MLGIELQIAEFFAFLITIILAMYVIFGLLILSGVILIIIGVAKDKKSLRRAGIICIAVPIILLVLIALL